MLDNIFYNLQKINMLDIQNFLWKPKIVYDITWNKWEFQIWPLPNGLGHSIWNVLRRTILAYSPAICITALKIDGVEHEYKSIDWVKEAVIDIMLNFKEIKLEGEIEEKNRQIWMEKTFKWVGKYYAKDLDYPAGMELLTEDQYLFEISDPNLELKVYYRLEKWYWYYSIDFLKKREKEKEDTDIWLLLIDNSFKVVKYVTYEVEEQLTDFTWWYKDIVTLKLETISDKISVKDLVTFAAEVLISYLKMFIYEDAFVDKSLLIEYEDIETSEGSSKKKEIEWVQKTPIDILPLSERTRNALIKNQIMFIEELEKLTKAELMSMKWVWKKAITEIETSLADIWKRLWI